VRKEPATTATIDARRSDLTEIELVRSDSEQGTDDLLAVIERNTARLAAEPGFAVASVHVSEDATVISCTHWSDDAARAAARTHGSLDDRDLPQLKDRDIATYEVVFVEARDGVEIGSSRRQSSPR